MSSRTGKTDRRGVLGHETGATLGAAGEFAAGLVGRARDLRVGLDEEHVSEARKLSIREIADEVGVKTHRAHSLLKETPGRQPGGRYSLNDLLALREATGTMRRRPEGSSCITIAISSFKGGVSKTTLAATLGHYLAIKGYRTLVVDVDPQGSLSTLLGLQPDINLAEDDTLLPYLAGDIDTLAPLVRPTELNTLSIIPASLGLEAATMILIDKQSKLGTGGGWFYAEVIANGLATIEQDYDVILLDCPPNMGPVTTSAVTAADALLVPLRPSLPDFASSAQFLTMFGEAMQDNDEAINRIFPERGGSVEKTFLWARVLLTQSHGRIADKEIAEYVRAAYGARVLGPEFPHLSAVAAAGNRMRTIYDVAKADVGRESLRRAQQIFDTVGAEIESLIVMSQQQLREVA